MNSPVGTTTFPPRWPHFFAAASWSSKCTPAAPASIIAFVISNAWSGPPNPASASATIGPKQFPEPFGPKFRERVPDPNRASQPFHVRSTIRPQDARPAFRGPPFLFQFHGLSRHAFPLPSFHCESPAYEGSRTQLSSSASRSGVSWTMKPPGGSAPVRFASGLFVESWKESDEDRATGDRTERFLSARTGHSGLPLETSRPELLARTTPPGRGHAGARWLRPSRPPGRAIRTRGRG